MDVEYFTEGKNEKHQNSKFKIQNSKFKIQEYFCQVQKAKHFFADSVFTKYLVSRR